MIKRLRGQVDLIKIGIGKHIVCLHHEFRQETKACLGLHWEYSNDTFSVDFECPLAMLTVLVGKIK